MYAGARAGSSCTRWWWRARTVHEKALVPRSSQVPRGVVSATPLASTVPHATLPLTPSTEANAAAALQSSTSSAQFAPAADVGARGEWSVARDLAWQELQEWQAASGQACQLVSTADGAPAQPLSKQSQVYAFGVSWPPSLQMPLAQGKDRHSSMLAPQRPPDHPGAHLHLKSPARDRAARGVRRWRCRWRGDGEPSSATATAQSRCCVPLLPCFHASSAAHRWC